MDAYQVGLLQAPDLEYKYFNIVTGIEDHIHIYMCVYSVDVQQISLLLMRAFR